MKLSDHHFYGGNIVYMSTTGKQSYHISSWTFVNITISPVNLIAYITVGIDIITSLCIFHCSLFIAQWNLYFSEFFQIFKMSCSKMENPWKNFLKRYENTHLFYWNFHFTMQTFYLSTHFHIFILSPLTNVFTFIW